MAQKEEKIYGRESGTNNFSNIQSPIENSTTRLNPDPDDLKQHPNSPIWPFVGPTITSSMENLRNRLG